MGKQPHKVVCEQLGPLPMPYIHGHDPKEHTTDVENLDSSGLTHTIRVPERERRQDRTVFGEKFLQI